jgi:nicotinic acid phosphoribosyltransferase
MESLTYSEKIANLAMTGTDEMFYNTDAEHAKVVLSELMKNAKQYVHIVCTDMCSDVSNNEKYLEAVKNFLDGDAAREIKILLTNYKQDNFAETKIAELLKKYQRQVEIKYLSEGRIVNSRDQDHEVNFTVSDDRAFRFETNVDKKIAFGNFNAPKKAMILNKKFLELFVDPNVKMLNLN